jgi:dolichol-phosphate mannosyltransferase
MNKRISVIIPLYNEEDNLPLLTGRLDALSFPGADMDFIFVDDCSTDNTHPLLTKLCAADRKYAYLKLSKNSGSHIAIIAGMQYAKGDAMVFMAGDMQDPPELISSMISEWEKGNKVVWAVRNNIQGVSVLQKFLSRSFYRLMNAFGNVKFPPSGADFALMDKLVADAVLKTIGSNPSLGGAIAAVGFRQTEITYTKQARAFGKSKWSLRKKLQAFADAFVAFSFAPMRIMTYVGLTVAILGFLYAAFIIVMRMFFIHAVSGWASLMVVILILGGLQMIMFGVLGEYLWRNLEEARKKPLYFIESSSDDSGV